MAAVCDSLLSQLIHLKFLDGLIEDCNERQVWPPVVTPTWWFSTTARPIGLEPNPEGQLELNQNESTLTLMKLLLQQVNFESKCSFYFSG